MKHLLKMMDLSTEEIIEILNLADQLKYELKHGIPHDQNVIPRSGLDRSADLR